MKQFFKKSDLDILLKVFIPGDYILTLHDPNQQVKQFSEPIAKGKLGSTPAFVLVSFSDISNFPVNSYDYIVDFSSSKIANVTYKEYSFIHNPDKSMRWIFPSDLKQPSFLNFYNASGFKAKVLSFLLKTLYVLRLQKLARSGGFRVYYKNTLNVESLIENIPHTNYSIFTGTVGPNRKLLVEVNNNGVTTHFAKWAISPDSEKIIATELSCIQKIQKLNLNDTVVPENVPSSHTDFLLYKNIKPQTCIDSKSLTDVHLKTLSEIYEKTITYNLSGISQFREHLIGAVYGLKSDERIPDSANLLEMLRSSLELLDFDTEIPFAVTHFDFTPWNMYVTSDKLYVYDWELSDKNAPILFDLFHYVFQKNILIDHTDLVQIKKEINQAIENPIMKDVINRYNINVDLCYKAYLLHTISYYMNVYSQQKELHAQVFWLVKIWYKAIEEVLLKKSFGLQRKNFTNQLLVFLNKFDYALMKFSENKISEIQDSSDLDILVRREDLASIIQYLKGSGTVRKIHKVEKTFMTTVGLFFEDGSFLSIDLLYGFKRKSLVLFSAEEILKDARKTDQGIKVPQIYHDFEYMILFYQLNGADMPQKYVNYFESFSTNDKKFIEYHMKGKYNLSDESIHNMFTYSETIKSEILQKVHTSFENKGWFALESKLDYVKDTLTDIFMNKGIIVTVSGVDGAGKSTIIEDLKNTFIHKFRKKVVVLRHRPSILPILSAWKHGKVKAEAMAAERLPRQGKNDSQLSSMIRFAYYYMDYLFGQGYIYARYVLRGYTVIYDRYYFDFIGDSKRSNLKLNAKFVTWLYTFIYKPKLNVLLYASPEVILKRKLELQEEDIKKLTHDYRFLFNQLSVSNSHSKYLSIENIDRAKTLDAIVKEYINVS